MKWRLSMVILFGALLVAWGQTRTLLLAWSPGNDADSFRVYCGPNSREYVTNWVTVTNCTTYEVTDVGRYWFAVRAERNFGSLTNFAVSPLSEEVMFELLPPPVVRSEPWVSLRPVIECSTNLISWSSVTGAATWFCATNAQEFFRTRQLVIERVQRVEAK